MAANSKAILPQLRLRETRIDNDNPDQFLPGTKQGLCLLSVPSAWVPARECCGSFPIPNADTTSEWLASSVSVSPTRMDYRNLYQA
jgi:hypothetical protein